MSDNFIINDFSKPANLAYAIALFLMKFGHMRYSVEPRNTIEVFVGRLRKKLGVDVLHTVRGMGYCVTEPEEAGKG